MVVILQVPIQSEKMKMKGEEEAYLNGVCMQKRSMYTMHTRGAYLMKRKNRGVRRGCKGKRIV